MVQKKVRVSRCHNCGPISTLTNKRSISLKFYNLHGAGIWDKICQFNAEQEGEEGGRGPSGRQEARGEEGGEPALREAPQELLHRPGHPAQEGPEPLRQMAQVHPAAEDEGRAADQAQDPASNQPVSYNS